jgi:hypothetical protein
MQGKNSNIKTGNKAFERVEQFRYQGRTQTNKNSIHEEIKSRVKSRNACCNSVQNLLSSSLPSKNMNIKIYRTIIVPVGLCGCERGLSSWGRHLGWGSSRIGCWGGCFGSKRDEITGEWRRLHKWKLYDLCSSPNIIRVIKPRRLRWAGHVARMGRGEVHTGFWWGNLKKNTWKDLDIDRRIVLRWICKEVGWGAWSGLSWLRIGTGGEHLWLR